MVHASPTPEIGSTRMGETTMRARALRITILLPLLLAVAPLSAWAERGDDSGRKSKNGKTDGTIDGVAISLEYGRPSVNGRQIWGGLVPLGSVWRTGADEASTITFDKDVLVQDQMLAAGTYGLFTIPGETEWVVIFNQVADQWGAFGYDPSEDALRVSTTARPGEHVESLDFVIDGSAIVLRWEQLEVPFAVATAP